MTARTVEAAPDTPPVTRKATSKAWADKAAKGKRKADERKRPVSAHEGRDQGLRAAEDVHQEHDEQWVRPSSLPTIPPRPGMVQRWVRVSTGNRPDATNISRRYREGWRPRKADTVPKGLGVPKINTGEYAGCIGVEGSILMEMPVERNEQRDRFYRQQRTRQSESVDQALAKEAQHNHPGFGRVRKATETKRVREVAVAADE